LAQAKRVQNSCALSDSMLRAIGVASLTVAQALEYCPSAGDFVTAYLPDNVQLQNQGWTVGGGGGAATKSTFNLNGGFVEYDIDLSGVGSGVNANIYTVAPIVGAEAYNHSTDYCDGQKNGTAWCAEMDWLESNGACGAGTTWHTIPGPGNDGCTAWGCGSEYKYNGNTKFHMKIAYDPHGFVTVTRDGKVVSNFFPVPDEKTAAVVKASHEQRGAVIVSTQWVGWVPNITDCGGSGNDDDLASSRFSVSNLKIEGSVVQGPTPTHCGTTGVSV